MSVDCRHTRPRLALTLIEMLTVVTTMLILLGIGAGAVLPSLRQGAVNLAAAQIENVAQQARQLAFTHGSSRYVIDSWPASSSTLPLGAEAELRFVRVGDIVATNHPAQFTITAVDGPGKSIMVSPAVPAIAGALRIVVNHQGRFGVCIEQVGSSQGRVFVTYGLGATPAEAMLRDPFLPASAANPPVVEYRFSRTAIVRTTPPSGTAAGSWLPTSPTADQQDLDGSIGWSYCPRTGYACHYDPTSAAFIDMIAVGVGYDAKAVNIGDAPADPANPPNPYQFRSPVADRLSIQSVDGRRQRSVRIFGMGQIDVRE